LLIYQRSWETLKGATAHSGGAISGAGMGNVAYRDWKFMESPPVRVGGGFADRIWKAEGSFFVLRKRDKSGPKQLYIVKNLFFALAGLQLLVSLLLIWNRGSIGNALEHSTMCSAARTARELRGCVQGTIVGTMGVHLVLALLLFVLAHIISRPDRWRRITATVFLGVFVASSWFVLSHTGIGQIFPPSIYPAVVVEQAVALALVSRQGFTFVPAPQSIQRLAKVNSGVGARLLVSEGRVYTQGLTFAGHLVFWLGLLLNHDDLQKITCA
jgi:hypothetical protein